MSIFQDVASEIGLPTGAVALAAGLVQGAKFLEKDASDRALHLFSDLLTKGDLKNIGKAGAGLVPFVFDRVFGSKPLSIRFISRTVLASTLFWLVLLLAKHVNWKDQVEGILIDLSKLAILIPLWYVLDWLSLSKARWLITLISQKYAITSSFLFLLLDVFISYTLSVIFGIFVVFTIEIINHTFIYQYFINGLKVSLYQYLTFWPIAQYFTASSEHSYLGLVIIPSTLLTSVWTFLFFVSCLLTQLLVPVDYLRRFTAFWFRDVEHHPITAIAKVAATLIVIGAMAIKAVRWIY